MRLRFPIDPKQASIRPRPFTSGTEPDRYPRMLPGSPGMNFHTNGFRAVINLQKLIIENLLQTLKNLSFKPNKIQL